jgi:predicted N-acetyltransferase YhbS
VEASGLEALALVSKLLHRVRASHATAGVWEASDFQWWWRRPRPSDAFGQAFWLDAHGPVAAAMVTAWQERWGLDPIALPGSDRATVAMVVDDGLERAAAHGAPGLETLVRDDDAVLASVLAERDFTPTDDRGGITWMDAAKRPPPTLLPDGFELIDRSIAGDQPHPMIKRNGPDVATRLPQVPLYDPALDLAIRHETGDVVGYALFWFDPVTHVGELEPMRVEDAWQRRGLARALLLHGLGRLAERRATRFKVSYASDPARALYTGAGFVIETTDTTWQQRALDREELRETE